MKLTKAKDLLILDIRDLYSAETQIYTALPDIIKKVSSKDFKEALQNHLEQTAEHIKRIKQIASGLKVEAEGEKCKGIEGILAEGKEILKLEGNINLVDLAISGACNRVESYEKGAYASAILDANLYGHDECIDLLQMTLSEEEDMFSLLEDISEDIVSEQESNKFKGILIE